MSDTNIEWADKVWNPVTGCDKVSAGCANCYAETFANRGMGEWGDRLFRDVKMHVKRLDMPRHWKKPRKIFVNSMGDMFHEKVLYQFWYDVVDVMTDCPQHTFLILTKRPERMVEFVNQQSAPSNCWLGTSVEGPDYLYRLDLLRKVKHPNRFVSFEPLLDDLGTVDLHGIGWAICGGESGYGARKYHLRWGQGLYYQCRAAKVPFFMKQVGANAYDSPMDPESGVMVPDRYETLDPKGGDPMEWPEDLRVREFPEVKA